MKFHEIAIIDSLWLHLCIMLIAGAVSTSCVLCTHMMRHTFWCLTQCHEAFVAPLIMSCWTRCTLYLRQQRSSIDVLLTLQVRDAVAAAAAGAGAMSAGSASAAAADSCVEVVQPATFLLLATRFGASPALHARMLHWICPPQPAGAACSSSRLYLLFIPIIPAESVSSATFDSYTAPIPIFQTSAISLTRIRQQAWWQQPVVLPCCRG